MAIVIGTFVVCLLWPLNCLQTPKWKYIQVVGLIGKVCISTYGRAQDIFSLLLFGAGGSFVSVCIAYVVNLSLVEITTSPVASVGFGMLFLFLGS